jgi:hypothetical protein
MEIAGHKDYTSLKKYCKITSEGKEAEIKPGSIEEGLSLNLDQEVASCGYKNKESEANSPLSLFVIKTELQRIFTAGLPFTWWGRCVTFGANYYVTISN